MTVIKKQGLDTSLNFRETSILMECGGKMPMVANTEKNSCILSVKMFGGTQPPSRDSSRMSIREYSHSPDV